MRDATGDSPNRTLRFQNLTNPDLLCEWMAPELVQTELEVQEKFAMIPDGLPAEQRMMAIQSAKVPRPHPHLPP